MKKIAIFLIPLLFLTLNLSAQNLDKLYEDAIGKMTEGDFKSAASIFDKILNKNSKFKDANAQRGLCLIQMEQFGDAILDFSNAIKQYPKNADYYNLRGLAYGYVGDIDLAQDDFTKAIKFDNKFAEAYTNRGSVYSLKGFLDSAMLDFDKSIKLDKQNPETYFLRAKIYYSQDKLEEAIKDLNISVKYGLTSPEVMIFRANAHFKLNKFENAIADYSQILNFDKTNLDALNNRAVAYDAVGDTLSGDKDREAIAHITGIRFDPIDKLNFISYVSSDSSIYINMPEGWNARTEIIEDETKLLMSYGGDPLNPDPFGINVTMSLNRNMQKRFGVSEPGELIEFWKASNGQNTQDYETYNLYMQKHLYVNSHPAYLIYSYIVIEEGYPPMRMYELVIAKEDALFYAYFQAGTKTFDYFKEIYDIAYPTIFLDETKQ